MGAIGHNKGNAVLSGKKTAKHFPAVSRTREHTHRRPTYTPNVSTSPAPPFRLATLRELQANKTKAAAASVPVAETIESAALVRHPGGESRRQCTVAAAAAAALTKAHGAGPSRAKTTGSRPKAQRSALALPDVVSTGAPESAGTGEENGDRGEDYVRRPIQVRQGAHVTATTSPMASTVTGWQGRDVRVERRQVERVSSDEARYGCKARGSSATTTGSTGGAEATRATTALESHAPAASSASAGTEIPEPRRKSQYTRCRSMPDLLGRLVREKNVWGR